MQPPNGAAKAMPKWLSEKLAKDKWFPRFHVALPTGMMFDTRCAIHGGRYHLFPTWRPDLNLTHGLPGAFRTDAATLPAAPAYLKADADRSAAWSARLGEKATGVLQMINDDKKLRGYKLGSVYIRKVHFRDAMMIKQIESKVVNRLRQVTSAIKQDGVNQVSVITSTAEKTAAIELAKAAAVRPEIVGNALRDISNDPDVAQAVAFYERAFGLTRRFVHESGTYAEMETGATALAFARAPISSVSTIDVAFRFAFSSFSAVCSGVSLAVRFARRRRWRKRAPHPLPWPDPAGAPASPPPASCRCPPRSNFPHSAPSRPGNDPFSAGSGTTPACPAPPRGKVPTARSESRGAFRHGIPPGG